MTGGKARNGAAVVSITADRVTIVLDQAGIYAVYLVCTHLGCTPNYVTDVTSGSGVADSVADMRGVRTAGDRVWRLPILADYRVLLRSQIADLRNAEYGEAGAILGGMFIGEFARGRPWAHLDIAASSWNTNSELTTVLRGPSGAGTRLCIELAELMAGGAR